MSDATLIVDADSHISEDLDRLVQMTDARYRHFAPRLIPQGDYELLYFGGLELPQPLGMSWGDTITPGAMRGSRPMRKWHEGDPRGFDPKARLAMMDGHGVAGAVLFPSVTLFSGVIREPRVAAAICRAGNRYAAEFAAEDSGRLWATGTVPLGDIELAIEEARYAVEELGIKAIFAPPGRFGPYPLYHAYYHPLYDALADMGVPFCTHAGAAVLGGGLGLERFGQRFPPYHMTNHVIEGMITCLGMLVHGVLDRRPDLRMGFFEAGAGWVPFWLEKLEEKVADLGWMMPEMQRDPRDTFKAQCAVTAEAGEVLLPAVLAHLEGRGVLWASDVPHYDCEDEGRPDRLLRAEGFQGDHKARLLGQNAVRFFDLPLACYD